MLREEKNLTNPIKDSKNMPAPYAVNVSHSEGVVSYTKTNKLITALYMVTDIVDKDEPLRNKLRTLGVEILSDITSPRGTLGNAGGKISELMSFLDIASAVNIISGMNCNILRKEFLELDQSIKESTGNAGIINKEIDLTEFLNSPLEESSGSGRREVDIPPVSQASHPSRGENSK